jgi:transposase-like protein
MFDEQKAEQITSRLCSGEPLSQIARDLGIGRTTIHDWRAINPAFAEQFARAKDAGYDALADECLTIADTQEVGEIVKDGPDGVTVTREDMLGHRRLRIESRLKLLAKWDPKRYGDRINVDADLRIAVTVNDPFAPLPATVVAQQSLPAQSPGNSLPMVQRSREGVGEGEIVEAVSQVPVLKSPPYPIA